jgi:hypothetical protein
MNLGPEGNIKQIIEQLMRLGNIEQIVLYFPARDGDGEIHSKLVGWEEILNNLLYISPPS